MVKRPGIKKRAIIFTVFLLLFQIIAGTIPVFAAEDYTPPLVNNLTISTQQVIKGGEIQVTAEVTDDVSGVKSVGVYFYSPSKSSTSHVPLYYNESLGLYEGTLTVAEFSEEGLWTLYFVAVTDNAGNGKNYVPKELPNEISYQVTNEFGDQEPPIIESIEASEGELGVGETLKVKADVSDDVSGVKNVGIYFYSPSKSSTSHVPLYYNESSGLYEGTLTVARFAEEGLWTLYFVAVTDNAGNGKNYVPKELPNEISYQVTNEFGDQKPPVIESIELSEGELGVGETLKVKADVSDDVSGVKNVGVYFYSPSKSSTSHVPLYYNESSGLYEGNLTVARFAEEGLWTLYFVAVTDNAGNGKNYSSTELTQVSKNNSYIVVHKPSDLDSPELNDPQLPYAIITKKEVLSNRTIDKDLYIGPNSTVSIDGNVTITGNVYIYGTLISHGGLTIQGSLNAKTVTYGSNTSESPGAVRFVGGQNSIHSTIVSNQAYEVPFTIYNEEITNETGTVMIEGKTLPFLNVSLSGKPVSLEADGSFVTSAEGVSTSDIQFNLLDVFGNNINKEITVKDVLPPEDVTGFTVSKTTHNEITVNWTPNTDNDLKEYALYLNEALVSKVNVGDNAYTFKSLTEATDYEVAIVAIDSSDNASEIAGTNATTLFSMPIVNSVSDQSTFVTGQAAPDTTVTIQQEESVIGSGKTDTAGNFNIEIPIQKAGTELSVYVSNEVGVVSEKKLIVVEDKTAPAISIVKEVTDKSIAIEGSSEAGAIVIAKVGEIELGKTSVNNVGNFSLSIPKQKAGTKINVYATDAAGNVSEATLVTVLDATAPTVPTVDEVTDKSTSVSGSGEAAALISIKAGIKEIAKTTVDETGKFSVSIPKQIAGTKLNITAADTAGNVSEAKVLTVVDVTASAVPVVDEVTDKSTIVTGSAEIGALISIKVGNVEIGKTTVASDGNYKATIALQKAGTKISVIVTDQAGNISEANVVTVLDVTAPDAPTVDKVTDQSTIVTGSAEVGTLITIKSGLMELGTAPVGFDGKYSVTILKQKAGAKLKVTSTDKVGHTSEETWVTVLDATAPNVPVVDVITDKSIAVTGLAEVNALISVKNGNVEIGTATVDSTGKFSVSITKQKAGTKLSITAEDQVGNVSEANLKTVLDVTAPEAPTVVRVTDKSTIVSGSGEVSAFISVIAGTTRLGTATVKADGTYSVTIAKQKAGTTLSITAIDEAGNVSELTLATVLDATAPDAPSVDEVTDKSTSVTGTAESSSHVSIKVGSKELGTAKTEDNGAYSVTIPKQNAGTKLSVRATDDAGNTSEATNVTVRDATAPDAPTVNEVTDKSTIVSGSGEVGAFISIKSGSTRLGIATVETDGTYSVTIPKQKAGTELSVTAVDQAGNLSEATLVTVVDATAPNAPSVDAVTDKSLAVTGSGEVDALITIKVGTTKLGSTTVKADGTYSISIPKQKAGTKLSITATDAAGNFSEVTGANVLDATAPNTPTVNEVNDKSTAVAGSGEVNALITVKAGSMALGSAKVEVDGTYSVTIPKQKAGTKLSVTATDAAGNKSSLKEVIVLDVTAPNLPTVNTVTDQSATVSGTSEAAAVISVKAGTSVIGTTTVKADGTYSVTIPKQKVGTVLTITASDKAGNTSPVKEVVVVDGTAPAVELTSKVTQHSIRVIGTAEAGAKIAIQAGTKSIGTAVANAKGDYEVVIAKQRIGTKLSIVATDAAGNSSAPLNVTVEDGNYPDLKLTHWALDEIMYLADDKIIGGYPNGGFQPEKKTTRAEAAKMLALAMDLPIKDVSSGYKDVSNKHWAKNYIAAVSKAGLFGGNPDGTFAPDAVLKRAEMAKVISIAYELKASNNNHFKDVKSGYWAKGYISGLYENGITTGYPDDTFRAEESTTRAEFSVFLARALNQDFR